MTDQQAIDFSDIEVLSFDCYGTIVDWEDGLNAALMPILAEHQIILAKDKLLELYARHEAAAERGPFKNYKAILRAVLLSLAEELCFTPTERQVHEFGFCVRNWPPFADSADALRRLSQRFRLVILSNIDDDLFAYSQRKLGVEFHKILTAEQIGSYKPGLANFEYLQSNAGVPKEAIVHVAQSLFHDIAPAQRLGFKAAWVNRRHGQKGFGATPPAAVQADYEVPDLRTLATATGV